MPDHLHLALGSKPNESPEQIALRYMNATAEGLGHVRLWQSGYYVGTFGEYTMAAVRGE